MCCLFFVVFVIDCRLLSVFVIERLCLWFVVGCFCCSLLGGGCSLWFVVLGLLFVDRCCLTFVGAGCVSLVRLVVAGCLLCCSFVVCSLLFVGCCMLCVVCSLRVVCHCVLRVVCCVWLSDGG